MKQEVQRQSLENLRSLSPPNSSSINQQLLSDKIYKDVSVNYRKLGLKEKDLLNYH